MTETSFTIAGGDYDRAGWASRNLKDQLKRIGAAPEIVRRVMIAAYEAEMNVVIHAAEGTMQAVLSENQVDVEVRDRGPGIADIPLAMTEGYSTAPPRARQLGFGAGLGLPNIRRNSDRFTIESTVGVGTRVRFSVYLRPQQPSPAATNSLHVTPSRCIECFRCLHACPTRALRVRAGRPIVLDYLCVDCTSCIATCAAGALSLEGVTESPLAAAGAVLVAPPAFVTQFAASLADVLAALARLGFAEIRLTAPAEQAVREAALAYTAARAEQNLPVISPVCPAVLNLVAAKFPSLLDSIAPFLSPIEAIREDLRGRRAAFVTLCPAQKTAIRAGGGPAITDILRPAVLASAVRPLLAESSAAAQPEPADSTPADSRVLRVTGMRHVVNVLEMIENGLIREPALLELFACDQGCFGSPLLNEEAFVSARRWQRSPESRAAAGSEATPCDHALRPRPGLRLADDMTEAIAKLAEIDRLTKTLPGQDCGLCGCPTCAALAEDIVTGRLAPAADPCVHRKSGRITP